MMITNWPYSKDNYVELFNYDSLDPDADPSNQVLKAEHANRIMGVMSDLQVVLQNAAVYQGDTGQLFLSGSYSIPERTTSLGSSGTQLMYKTPRFFYEEFVFEFNGNVFIDNLFNGAMFGRDKAAFMLNKPNSGRLFTRNTKFSSYVYLSRPYGLGGKLTPLPPIGMNPIAISHNLYADIDNQMVGVNAWWHKPLTNFLTGPMKATYGTSPSADLSLTNRSFYEYDWEYNEERNFISTTSKLVFQLIVEDCL